MIKKKRNVLHLDIVLFCFDPLSISAIFREDIAQNRIIFEQNKK